MTKVTLTQRAEARLDDILIWTEETFGPAQTDRYASVVLDRIARLGDGTAQCRSCDLLTGHAEDADLEVTRAGEHLIVFKRLPDEIPILDFLHGRRDLPQHLPRLSDLKET